MKTARRLLLAVLTAALTGATAEAGGKWSIGVGFGVPGPFAYRPFPPPYAYPRPYYYAPYPAVYVAPRPVYVYPQPVYVAPGVYQAPAYLPAPGPASYSPQ